MRDPCRTANIPLSLALRRCCMNETVLHLQTPERLESQIRSLKLHSHLEAVIQEEHQCIRNCRKQVTEDDYLSTRVVCAYALRIRCLRDNSQCSLKDFSRVTRFGFHKDFQSLRYIPHSFECELSQSLPIDDSLRESVR